MSDSFQGRKLLYSTRSKSVKAGASREPRRLLLKKKALRLVGKHLGPVLRRLFPEFTGLHCQIAWLPGREWDAHNCPICGSVCCKVSGFRVSPECQSCGPRRMKAVLRSARGSFFTCGNGVRNFWLPVRVRGESLGIAYLQALAHPRQVQGKSRSQDRQTIRGARAVVCSRVQFSRAIRFLRLVVEYVETASLNDLRQADLTSAGRAMVALEKEQAHLHEILAQYMSAAPDTPRTVPESQSEQVVHALLSHVEANYSKPITLQGLAKDMGMNTSYLSALFSRAVGIPFKTYLTELRIHQAKELLGNASNSLSEVAYAVGYASEERFRFIFKKATGLSPKVWRETMQTG